MVKNPTPNSDFLPLLIGFGPLNLLWEQNLYNVFLHSKCYAILLNAMEKILCAFFSSFLKIWANLRRRSIPVSTVLRKSVRFFNNKNVCFLENGLANLFSNFRALEIIITADF